MTGKTYTETPFCSLNPKPLKPFLFYPKMPPGSLERKSLKPRGMAGGDHGFGALGGGVLKID